jgi:hypothetical protein
MATQSVYPCDYPSDLVSGVMGVLSGVFLESAGFAGNDQHKPDIWETTSRKWEYSLVLHILVPFRVVRMTFAKHNRFDSLYITTPNN